MTDPASTERRAATLAEAAARFDDGSLLADLSRLVAQPSESQRDDAGADLQAYLAGLLVPMLETMGFATRIHRNPVPTAPPILLATRIEDPDLPTVLVYGHGDTVRGQAGLWSGGMDPFTLTRTGERLYGRGTADNKGQHLINIAALKAVLAVEGRLGFNVKLLIEMAEETGSPGLDLFCAEERAALAADVLIASDGPRLSPERPTIFTGARGAKSFELTVDLRDGAHHSGNFGGLLSDPAILLAQAIASITDARGALRIPEWRPDSLTPRIREVISALPPVEAGFPLSEGWGEPGLSPQERVFGWNSFAVLAMTSGLPDAPQNAIAGRARATCQLRYVVGTDREAIVPALRRHLDAAGLSAVQVTERDEGAFGATRLDPDHPWVRFAAASLEASTGLAPHVLPNLGGSLPNGCFAETLGLPTVWMPHSYAGCRQHGPDEHALAPLLRQAVTAMAGLWWDIGHRPDVPPHV
ncbi:M20 family metallopeptidase [Frigidibacter sp. MR17.14]|uniref:M20 family metallopeptidase n=1 Tax=Frigidibacter sp. MR17.14 TaxID=3126509 RepID=UPI003012E5C1